MADATRTIRTRFDGDASGLRRAARQAEGDIDRFGRNAGRAFTSRFRSWVTGQGARDGNTIGRFFGRTFGTGLLSGFSVPVFGPLMAGALLAVVATVAPIIGAALASGVVLAFGAGLAGLGIAFAAQSQRVKSAFTALKNDLVVTMQSISRPFEATLVSIAGFIRRTFDTLVPTLRSVFASIAPQVTMFADHFFGAFEKFQPALKSIGDAFGDLLNSLGPKLPTLFADIADTITDIGNTVSKYSDEFASLITFLVDAADAVVELVGSLANFYGLVSSNADKIAIALTGPLGQMADRFARTGQGAAEGAPKIGHFAGQLGNASTQADAATSSLQDYLNKMREATDPVFALTAALTGVDETQAAYNATVKEYGVNSPQATAAALNHASALSTLEQAALAGDVSFGAFETQLVSWVRQGRITAAEAATIRARVAEARGEAENFKGNYRAVLEAETAVAATRLAAIRTILASIRDKTITITARANIPAGLTQRAIEYYESRANNSASTAWFAHAQSGTHRTDPPLNFTATIQTYLDGRIVDQRVHSIVAESESRSAWRANVGRR